MTSAAYFLYLGLAIHLVEASSICPLGWISSVVPQKCLRLITRKQLGPQAHERCADIHGALASIESAEEDEFVKDNVLNRVEDWLLIGGTMDPTTKSWSWEVGVPFEYENWGPDETFKNNQVYLYYFSHSNHKSTPYYGKWHASAYRSMPAYYMCELRLPTDVPETSTSCAS